jgi:hypothetical protein
MGISSAVEVPAHAAYLLPDVGGASVRENQPIERWNPVNQILWYGQFQETGEITCAVAVSLPENKELSLTMTLGKNAKTVLVKGAAGAARKVDFGTFPITKKGYQSFVLSTTDATNPSPAAIGALTVEGAASKGLHFNVKERRNAASVHLSYPQPPGVNVAGFYCEVTAEEDPLATYYMACGWHRGYFGMQVNGPNERRIIFSVWDSGNEAVSRDKVGDEDRVALIAKGEGVYTGDFGNEGTGGHSHLKYLWKTGSVQKFFVTARVIDATHTIFTGYWFHPEKNAWMLISSWRAPKEGKYLRGLYSFSENFDGRNGHLLRKARFGNQWIVTDDKKWIEVTRASFSHDGTGKSDRLDRFMGVENGQFFLSQGGFGDGFTAYGAPFDRPAIGKAPALTLPDHRQQ